MRCWVSGSSKRRLGQSSVAHRPCPFTIYLGILSLSSSSHHPPTWATHLGNSRALIVHPVSLSACIAYGPPGRWARHSTQSRTWICEARRDVVDPPSDGWRTGTKARQWRCTLMQQIFSCSRGPCILLLPGFSEFLASNLCGYLHSPLCTVLAKVHFGPRRRCCAHAVDACPSTPIPSLPLPNAVPATAEAAGTGFCGLLGQESTKPKVTDISPAVPPPTGHKPCFTACLLIDYLCSWNAVHYLATNVRFQSGPGNFPREPDDICTVSWPQKKTKAESIQVYTWAGIPSMYIHTYIHNSPRAGRACMPSDGDVASPHALP